MAYAFGDGVIVYVHRRTDNVLSALGIEKIRTKGGLIMKTKRKIAISEIVLLAVLVIYSISILYLIFWGLLTSLKTQDDFLIEQNIFGFPAEFAWDNYQAVFKRLYIQVTRDGVRFKITLIWQIIYTLLYAGVGCLLAALAPFLVAYACSRFHYKFNEVLETLVFVVMIVPVVGSTTSMLSLLHQLNLYDTFLGVYCEKFYFTSIYFLIYRGILKGLSKSFSEAATIDGANEFQIMVRINFPLVINVFATIALMYFITFWNDYQTPLLYMPTHPTLAYGIFNLTQMTTGDLNITPRKMAGCMILVVPITILFAIFKDKLMTNLSVGGVKE